MSHNRTPEENEAIGLLTAFSRSQGSNTYILTRKAAQVILRRMEILEMLLAKAQNPLYAILVRIDQERPWYFYSNNGGLTLNEVDAAYLTKANAERQMAILKQAWPSTFQFKIVQDGSW